MKSQFVVSRCSLFEIHGVRVSRNTELAGIFALSGSAAADFGAAANARRDGASCGRCLQSQCGKNELLSATRVPPLS